MMPAGYSWIRHVISESAAQAQTGAWLARTGFLLWGMAVLWLTVLSRRRWGPIGAFFLGAFGIFMTGTAAYSHKPWQEGVPFDAFEDLLHSVTATGMGMSFAIGVTAILLSRREARLWTRIYDLVAIISAAVLPIGMANAPAIAGGLQRLLFAMAYTWFGLEALRSASGLRRDQPRRA
jgi:hypothetical protein